MGVDIRLLGPPQIVVEGEPRRLKGRKSWGLLAHVLLEPRTTRRELVDRLFADAEDPMATLRWHLLQVRRAVEPAYENLPAKLGQHALNLDFISP